MRGKPRTPQIDDNLPFDRFFTNAFSGSRTLAKYERCGPIQKDAGREKNPELAHSVDRTVRGARGARGVVMLIESTEQFQASEAIAIRRGPNEVAESDYAELTPAIRTKLRILQEHGVVRLHSPADPDKLDRSQREPAKKA